MAEESSDDSGLMDKIMNRIKGPGESGPSRTDSSQRKVLISVTKLSYRRLLDVLFGCLVVNLDAIPRRKERRGGMRCASFKARSKCMMLYHSACA